MNKSVVVAYQWSAQRLYCPATVSAPLNRALRVFLCQFSLSYGPHTLPGEGFRRAEVSRGLVKQKSGCPDFGVSRRNFLLTKTEFLNECAVLVNVFFRVVGKQALALAYHGEQGAARGVVFLIGAKVSGKAFDAVGQQGDLGFGVARVLGVAAVLCDDLRYFFFVVIDCHFLNDKSVEKRWRQSGISAGQTAVFAYPSGLSERKSTPYIRRCKGLSDKSFTKQRLRTAIPNKILCKVVNRQS